MPSADGHAGCAGGDGEEHVSGGVDVPDCVGGLALFEGGEQSLAEPDDHEDESAAGAEKEKDKQERGAEPRVQKPQGHYENERNADHQPAYLGELHSWT